MKIFGHEPLPFIVEEVHFPRPDNICLVFKFKTVSNFDEFDKVYPEVTPMFKHFPDGTKEQYFDDENYKFRVNKRNMARIHWLYLKSIEATEGLTWDTIDMGNPETWGNYTNELNSWLTMTEQVAMLNACQRVNVMTEDMLKEARESFLAGKLRPLQPTPISPRDEASSTSSGEPVVSSESDLPVSETTGTT